MEKLYKCNAYNELKSNKARIDYLLTNVIDYDQAKSVIKSSIDNVRRKNGKNLVMAKNCKIEADFYLQQVSLGNLDDKCKNLASALKYYTRDSISVILMLLLFCSHISGSIIHAHIGRCKNDSPSLCT
ncbi:hypothetical protein BLA29_005911 [Euroglyphus maynei]|uniref:Uncharacterized protein n=1 Tax=Euroglyphus maynei TaxID=6958 RepID=A0A1Y3B048_EURMA|nr:hypothetical protein BLA29_005911 [Euroglyphus maynei]